MSLLAGLYGTTGTVAAPALRGMLARRAARGKEVPARLAERWGVASLPRPAGRLIWFHAASVGESLSILPVIAALQGQAEVLLTTGTATSARLAAERLPAFARHQFVPLDTPSWTSRFLDHWRPDCAVFVESELWPTLLAGIDSRGIPRVLVNARMSARSAAGWRRMRWFHGILFTGFRYVHAQSAGDAAQLRGLGIDDALDWGNLKYAGPVLPADQSALQEFRAALPGPCWLAASTHEGEEPMIIAAHRSLLREFPDLVTLIVPRHPERGGAVAALAADLPVGQLSRGALPVAGGLFIADTLGELGLFYRLAPFAFIGNSLAGSGGHNVIEPARLGRAVIVGPLTQNFAEPVARLRAAGGLIEVADTDALTQAVRHWLMAPDAAAIAGAAAQAAFAGGDALPERLAALILSTAL
jgi:3-deoxy-D-manno-octulosonic-acid transferase